jgi:hypothetical protein
MTYEQGSYIEHLTDEDILEQKRIDLTLTYPQMTIEGKKTHRETLDKLIQESILKYKNEFLKVEEEMRCVMREEHEKKMSLMSKDERIKKEKSEVSKLLLFKNQWGNKFRAEDDFAETYRYWKNEKHFCECGGKFMNKNEDIHIKSKKHIGYINAGNIVKCVGVERFEYLLKNPLPVGYDMNNHRAFSYDPSIKSSIPLTLKTIFEW